MRLILFVLPLTALAGCVQPVVMPAAPRPAPVTPAPSTAPVPRPVAPPVHVPDAPAAIPAPAPATATVAPTTAPNPAPAAPSGPLDSRTGLHQAAIVAVTGNATRGFTVLLRPDATQPARISAAPGKLCGAKGVASSATNTPKSGSAIPGVQVMVVKCGGNAA